MKKLFLYVLLLLFISLSSNAKEIFGIKLDDNLNSYKILHIDEKKKIASIDAPIKNKDFGVYTVSFSEDKKIFLIAGHLKENFISQSKCMGALKKYFKVLNSKLELDLHLDNKTEQPNQIIHFYGPNMGLLFEGSTASIIQCELRDKKYYGGISLWNTLSQTVDKESKIDTSGFSQNYKLSIPIWDQYSVITCHAKIAYSYKDGKIFKPLKPISIKEIDFNKNMVFHKIIINNEVTDMPIANRKIVDKYFVYSDLENKAINKIYVGNGVTISFFVTENKIRIVRVDTFFNQTISLSHYDCF